MFDPRRIVELVVLIHPSIHLKIKKKKRNRVSFAPGIINFLEGEGDSRNASLLCRPSKLFLYSERLWIIIIIIINLPQNCRYKDHKANRGIGRNDDFSFDEVFSIRRAQIGMSRRRMYPRRFSTLYFLFFFSTRRSKSPPRRLPLLSSILCYHYCSYYYFLFLFFRNILHLLKIIILFSFFYLSFASSSLALLRSPLLLVRRFNTTIVAPDRNPGNIYGFVYFVLFLCQPRVYPSPEDKGGGSFAGLHAFMRDKIDG